MTRTPRGTAHEAGNAGPRRTTRRGEDAEPEEAADAAERAEAGAAIPGAVGAAMAPFVDVARSTVGLGWSLALLGADAATRVLSGRAGSPTAGLDAVRHAAEGELDETFRGIYRAGERMQERALDGAASALGGAPPIGLDPRNALAALGAPLGRLTDLASEIVSSAAGFAAGRSPSTRPRERSDAQDDAEPHAEPHVEPHGEPHGDERDRADGWAASTSDEEPGG